MDTFTQRFDATAASCRPARRFAASHFADDSVCDIVALLTSELAQNAIRHGDGTPFTVVVEHREKETRVCVSHSGDGGKIPERCRDAFIDLDAESGRGLYLVKEMAPTFGYAIDNMHVLIWFSYPAPPKAAAVLVAA